MKRSTAIVAAIVVVAVIVAAAVGVMLLSPPGGSGDNGPGDTPDGRPSGPEGTVNGAVVNIGTNESNASAFDDMMGVFQNTTNAVGEPDALCQVAVTNNQTENVVLNCANFTATTSDGKEVKALNANNITIEPNTTAYFVLGFKTNGTLITGISYTGNVKFDMSVMSKFKMDLGPTTMMQAPENLTAIDNLTFESPNSWTISNGSMSLMPLFFDEGEKMILAVVIGTNNNTTAVDLAPTNFWIDLGNGTWVQAEDGRNNNIVKTLEPDSAKAFMIGFRVNETVSPTAIYYWPDQSTNATVMFQIDPQQPPQQPASFSLFKVWSEENNNTTGTRLFVGLNDSGDTPASGITLNGWTMKEGRMEAQTTQSNRTNGTVFVFDLSKGDTVTLLSYQDGGQTRYLWIRPVVPS